MRWPRLRALRLQERMVLLFVALLMAVQLAAFFFIRVAIEEIASQTLREELQVGARVFRRLLDQNSQQLVEATSVLTYDFGFREAIATRDRDTILSALRNHASRIRASGMAVVGLDGRVVADTMDEARAGGAYAFPDLVAQAESQGRASGMRVVSDKPYQVIVVPIRAPLPIAWVAMSFVIDDASARDLKTLASSDVTFIEIAAGAPRVLATTLEPGPRAALELAAGAVIATSAEGSRLMLGGEDTEVLATPIERKGAGNLYSVLQRPVAAGLEPFRALQLVLVLLACLSIAVTALVANRLARRLARPLARLAQAAGEVAKGRYDIAVEANEPARDEIDELALAFRGMTKGLAERDKVRDVLGKVASAAVADELMRGAVELGGEEREVTVMFTDIRNFTTLCESLKPQASLALLNDFLTVISEVVEQYRGVVDKYTGDGAMAVFGAPVAEPGDAQRAVEAALEIRRRVLALGPSLAARGLPHPEIGIGLNTARVIAGNIGSSSRLNYTVLGDGVNLASRFEGLTKRYRVPIVVGELTQRGCAGVLFRELDKVRVRGRVQPVRIFEPLQLARDATTRAGRALDTWHAALADYRERRWDRARGLLERLEHEPGYERLAELYLGYLAEVAARPPGPDWDAAFTLFEK